MSISGSDLDSSSRTSTPVAGRGAAGSSLGSASSLRSPHGFAGIQRSSELTPTEAEHAKGGSRVCRVVLILGALCLPGLGGLRLLHGKSVDVAPEKEGSRRKSEVVEVAESRESEVVEVAESRESEDEQKEGVRGHGVGEAPGREQAEDGGPHARGPGRESSQWRAGSPTSVSLALGEPRSRVSRRESSQWAERPDRWDEEDVEATERTSHLAAKGRIKRKDDEDIEDWMVSPAMPFDRVTEVDQFALPSAASLSPAQRPLLLAIKALVENSLQAARGETQAARIEAEDEAEDEATVSRFADLHLPGLSALRRGDDRRLLKALRALVAASATGLAADGSGGCRSRAGMRSAAKAFKECMSLQLSAIALDLDASALISARAKARNHF